MLFLTVSRQTGSYGVEIAELLAKRLNLPVITRDFVMNEWFTEIASPHELHMLTESPAFFLTNSSTGITFAEHLENRLKQFVADQPAIILGLGGQLIFAQHPQALHVKIIASTEIRINRVMKEYSLERQDAARFLELTDRKHRKHIATIYNQDWSNPGLYHLILNTDSLSVDDCASLLFHLLQNKQTLSPSTDEQQEEKENQRVVVFKHPSEEEFAKILDMHDIAWQYEPRTFPIKWDPEGNITLAFSPDFYLPRFNTYIELTTMNQKYVAEKKKKVQLLKKLYPGTNISIVFKDDFYTLVKRFGLQGGHEEI